MNQIDSVQAALFAFKKRERGWVLTGATAAYLLLRLAIGAALVALTWPLWGGLFAWYGHTLGAISSGGEPGPPPLAALSAAIPFFLVAALLGMVLFAAYEAACLRWMVRGESGGGFLGLNLGADTWRVFSVYWLWVAVTIGFVMAVAVFYVALNFIGRLHSGLQIVAALVGALTPIGLGALLIWGGVRLAPAAALSVGRQRFTFFGAWSQTKGGFWPVLGAFVLVIVGYLVVATIAQGLMRIPFTARLAPAWTELVLGDGDAQAFVTTVQEAFSDPLLIALGVAYVLVSIVIASLFLLAMFGVNAAVARDAAAPEAPPASS